jgi:hypothetical protein
MSSYIVLSAVSEVLRHILWEEINADPVTRTIVAAEANISLANPTQTAQGSANRLSVWLHQVTENEFLKNQPIQRSTDADNRQFPPLALNLFYLITPFAPTAEADQMLLGKIVQVLYDNACVLVRNQPNEIAEELRIVLCRMSLEELTRVWEALREPYRLSVCYEVRVTRVDSRRRAGQGRVIERIAGFGSKPEEPVGA